MKKLYENPFALVVEVEDIDCITFSFENDLSEEDPDEIEFES